MENGTTISLGSSNVDGSNGLIVARKSIQIPSAFDFLLKVEGLKTGTTTALSKNGVSVVKSGSQFRNMETGILIYWHGIIEEGVLFDNLIYKNPTSGNATSQSGASNKATFNKSSFSWDNSASLGFPVDDGAVFTKCDFSGKQSVTDYRKYYLIGKSVLKSGLGALGGFKYIAASAELVFDFGSTAPQVGDGAGTHTDIASGTTFNGMLHAITTTGGEDDFTAAEGQIYEWEYFEDTGDAYGYGAGNWIIRSTSNSTKQLFDLLGGSDLNTSTSQPQNSVVLAKEASITIEDCDFDGIAVSPEITILHPEREEVDQNVTLAGDEKLVIIDDNQFFASTASYASSGSIAAATTRASIASIASRALFASAGSVASVASGASIASRPSYASQGSVASRASVASIASASSLATAASYGSVGSSASISGKVSVTMSDFDTELTIKRIGSSAAYVSVDAPSGKTLDGKTSTLLSQYESIDVFKHELDFYIK
jgi:hypothetical protein